MKIEIEDVYVGDIYKCTEHRYTPTMENCFCLGEGFDYYGTVGYIVKKGKLYKSNAILVKIKNGGFVDIDSYKTFIDYIKICRDITKNGFILDGIVLETSPHKIDSLYVESDSLVPYSTTSRTFKGLKRELKQKR